MITLHHLENSRSQRILWLLEELALPYEIQFYKRDPVTMFAPPELRAIHPLGKSPILTDGDLVLAESGAIIEYLVHQYGQDRLRPKTGREQIRYTYWLHYAEGSLMPPILMKLIFGILSRAPTPILFRPLGALIGGAVLKSYVHPQIRRHLDYIEAEISKSPYLAGSEFSAADIQMSFPLEALKKNFSFEKYPHLKKYLDKIQSRPAYAKAIEKGGPLNI